MAKETKIIGSIRIDSASCWIGDPAHVYDVQRMRLQDLQYGYEAKEDEAQFEDHENYQDYYGKRQNWEQDPVWRSFF